MSDSDSSSDASEYSGDIEQNLVGSLSMLRDSVSGLMSGIGLLGDKCKPMLATINAVMDANKETTELWKAEELCDVTVTAGDVSIKAHKIILASHSPYFKAMFCGNFPDAKKDTVDISGKLHIMHYKLEFFTVWSRAHRYCFEPVSNPPKLVSPQVGFEPHKPLQTQSVQKHIVICEPCPDGDSI